MIRNICIAFKTTLLLTLFLTQINFRANANTTPKIWVVTKDRSGDFTTIQEAILNESVSAGDIIFVRNGIYAENIIINKSISLVGEDSNMTIICGNFTTSVISVEANDVSIANFMITGSGFNPVDSAITIEGFSETIISCNKIINNNNGISLVSSSNNIIFGNIIENNSLTGIFAFSSRGSSIISNVIARNTYGLNFYYSHSNNVSDNTIKDNTQYGTYLYYSGNNVFYHNNFKNAHQILNGGVKFVNRWDYGGEGNYWSDYNGSDFYMGLYKNETGCDGIGDDSYIIDENNRDDFPLLGLFSPYDLYFKDEKYRFMLISNSTVSNFSFEVGVETGNMVVRFNVTGEDGSAGFCRVSVPTMLMNYSLIVLVDGEEVTPTLLSSMSEAYVRIYFTYTHSVHNITIISSKTLNLYNALLAELIQLQEKLGGLNISYYALLNIYMQLQGNYTDLREMYQELLRKHNDNLQNLQNLTCAFLTAMTLFLIVTVYLSMRAHLAHRSRVKADEDQNM